MGFHPSNIQEQTSALEMKTALSDAASAWHVNVSMDKTLVLKKPYFWIFHNYFKLTGYNLLWISWTNAHIAISDVPRYFEM